MSLAACLAFYGVLVAVAAPRLLRRGAVEQTPRLGVALWSFAVGTTLLAWLAAIGVVVADALMVTAGAACEDCLPVSVLPAEGSISDSPEKSGTLPRVDGGSYRIVVLPPGATKENCEPCTASDPAVQPTADTSTDAALPARNVLLEANGESFEP